jgi:hypothetical protein
MNGATGGYLFVLLMTGNARHNHGRQLMTIERMMKA